MNKPRFLFRIEGPHTDTIESGDSIRAPDCRARLRHVPRPGDRPRVRVACRGRGVRECARQGLDGLRAGRERVIFGYAADGDEQLGPRRR